MDTSNTKRKLDKWAYEYRKERGEEKKYCPDRTKKHEAIEARKRGKNPDFVKGTKKNFQRRQAGKYFDVAATGANQNDDLQVRKAQKSKDADLISFGKKQAQIHKSEWAQLSHNYQEQKRGINQRAKADKKRVGNEIFAQGKPYYVAMLRTQRAEMAAFNAREKRIVGKLNNMVAAVTHSAKLGRPENNNVVSNLFKVINSKAKRRAWIEAKHDKQIREFKSDQNQQKKTAFKQINRRKSGLISSALELFTFNRAALIKKQDTERAELKERWKDRNTERQQVLKQVKRTTEKSREAQAAIVDGVEYEEVNKAFKRSTRPKRTRTGRTRKRERE